MGFSYVRWMDSKTSATEGFFLDILSSPSEKCPLEFVTMTMYCSGDLMMAEGIYIFYPLPKSLPEKTIPYIWDHCFSKRTGNVQPLVNISEINLKKLFRHVTANA